MFVDALGAPDVKLIDFGLAYVCSSLDGCKTLCGTYVYTAPEIRRGETYGYAVDMWALGVLTYACISGEMPACASYQPAGPALDNCLEDECSVEVPLSDDARVFLCALLQPEPGWRLTSAAAVSHVWLQKRARSSL